MSASIVEKAVIAGSMIGLGVFGTYYTIKNRRGATGDKNELYKKRLEILERDNVKILYSTMSFLYLEGYKKNDLNSFFTLYDILQLAKPNLVAIPLSEKEYREDFQSLVQSAKFDEMMQRAEYFAKIQSDEITTIKDLQVDALDKLYPIYFCKKNRCKVIYADKPQEEYDLLVQAKLKLKDMYSETAKEGINVSLIENKTQEELAKSKEDIEREVYFDRREDYFVDSLMREINPKFTLVPSSLYKTVVGVTEPQHLKGIAARWKNKFKATYNHEIVEDEDSQKRG